MITVRAIRQIVAEATGVAEIDLVSARRSDAVARARQIAMWAARTYTCQSLPAIGRMLGDRDHTTVLYGIRRIEAEIDAATTGKSPLASDLLTVMTAVQAMDAVLDQVGADAPPDIDPLEIARIALLSPGRAASLSAEQIRVLAGYAACCAAFAAEAVERKAISEHRLQTIELPVETPVPSPVVAAVPAAIAAYRELQAARFSRGEASALAACDAAMRALAEAYGAAIGPIAAPRPAFKRHSKPHHEECTNAQA